MRATLRRKSDVRVAYALGVLGFGHAALLAARLMDSPAPMLSIFGVRVPVVKSESREAEVRFAMPKRGERGMVYEFRHYASWAEAERETGLTLAKLRWDILKFLRDTNA